MIKYPLQIPVRFCAGKLNEPANKTINKDNRYLYLTIFIKKQNYKICNMRWVNKGKSLLILVLVYLNESMRKYRFTFLFIVLVQLIGYTQEKDIEIELLKKLDSISKSSSITRHFASLYFETTVLSIVFFANADPAVKSFIERLENNFAGFFFQSADAYFNKTEIPVVWQSYYRDSTLSTLQYKLLGINAHINGDIWQALTSEFSGKELMKNRNIYLRFQKALQKQYLRFYDEYVSSNLKTGLLNNTTLGLTKIYGKMMLSRWRKRQLRLAILYHTDKTKFEDALSSLTRKREELNRLILRNL